MIEMRWLSRPVGKKLDGAKMVTAYEKVLQYRQQFTGELSVEWTEWKDVPDVIQKS